MKEEQKNLPKATPEIVKEYDELQQKLKGLDPSWTDKEANEVSNRIYELETNYDWFNVEFTDPVTGKKGLKTVAGELIAPAQYASRTASVVSFEAMGQASSSVNSSSMTFAHIPLLPCFWLAGMV